MSSAELDWMKLLNLSFCLPTTLSTPWCFRSHICPHALCTFCRSKWSANKGRPPLKDPAVLLSQCSHVKLNKGVLLLHVAPIKSRQLIPWFITLIASNGFAQIASIIALNPPPQERMLRICVHISVHYIASSQTFPVWRAAEQSLAAQTCMEMWPRRIKPFEIPRLSAEDFKGPKLCQSGDVRRFSVRDQTSGLHWIYVAIK